MRVIRHIFLLFLPLVLSATALRAADSGRGSTSTDATERVTIRAILVVASTNEGRPDPKLAAYIENLRKGLPSHLKSFRHAGEAVVPIGMPGSASVALSRGQRLELEAAYYGSNQTWMRVRWFDGDSEALNTVAVRKTGAPLVLIRGLEGGESLAVIVIPE